MLKAGPQICIRALRFWSVGWAMGMLAEVLKPHVLAPLTPQYMFYGAISFNADIRSWDVGSVTRMEVCAAMPTGYLHMHAKAGPQTFP